jgi:hypothetical protein
MLGIHYCRGVALSHGSLIQVACANVLSILVFCTLSPSSSAPSTNYAYTWWRFPVLGDWAGQRHDKALDNALHHDDLDGKPLPQNFWPFAVSQVHSYRESCKNFQAILGLSVSCQHGDLCCRRALCGPGHRTCWGAMFDEHEEEAEVKSATIHPCYQPVRPMPFLHTRGWQV